MSKATKVIVSLFDESGNMGRPWAKNGWEVYCFDILNKDKPTEHFDSGGFIQYNAGNLKDTELHKQIIAMRPRMVFGFPPCTDLAVSGAAHFKKKSLANPKFQDEAVALCRVVETIGEACGCPWFVENPKSVLATKWRKPNKTFHPWEFGGYLPVGDIHPRWPEYIAPQDAYKKETYLWTSKGFSLPMKNPVPVAPGNSTQYSALGGKSKKTKQIRSETPRGFAQAIYNHYSNLLA